MINEILTDLYNRKFISKSLENCRKEKFEGSLEDFLNKIREILKNKNTNNIILFSPTDPKPGAEVKLSIDEAIKKVKDESIPEDFILKDDNENLLFYIGHDENFWIIYF
ncbi:MAG: hypothetical protein ACE5J4_02465 [Candidatus Aenigmatarchaeota archaeon]